MKRGLVCKSKIVRAAIRWATAILLFSGFRMAVSAWPPQAPSKGPGKLTITTQSLPNAVAGVEYYAVMAAKGGEPPYDFSGTGLPPNLAFHYLSDTIGGKATTPGTYSVIMTARDSSMPAPQTASVTLKLTVIADK